MATFPRVADGEWGTRQGLRVRLGSLEPPFPRSRHLYRSPDSTSRGLVDNINPAIETFFKLVGNERPSKLLLTFFLGQCLIPGLPLDLYDENCAHQWFTMELPNVAEKLRSIYTAGSMDVIWKGKFWKRRFQKQREIIESCWEIVELEEFDEARGVGRRAFTLPWIRFTLRSKELPELLLAEEPAPHSGWGFYSIQDDRTLIRFGPE